MKNKKYYTRPSPEKELAIYKRFLVNFHTANWTGNIEKVKDYIKKIGDYSYARTNSNGDWEQDEQNMIKTLLNLDEC